jgi:DNA repair exonuclease SbcCD nuclease subunit
MEFEFIATGDTHFGLSTYGIDLPEGTNSRSLDGFSAFDQLIDYAISNKIKLITHSGDIFDRKTVSQTIVNEFYKRVKRISDAGIDFVILSGNHDKSTLRQAKCSLDLINTITIPNIYETDGLDLFDLGYVQVATLGYYLSNEEIEAQLKKFNSEIDWTRPAILLGHLQVETPQFANASFKEDLHLTPLALLTQYPYQFISLGHLHKPVELNANPPCYYNGSLVRCSFAEENDSKGFNVVTVNGLKPIFIKRQEVDCLKMLTINGTMSEIKDKLQLIESKSFKNTIIRVIVDETEETIDEKWLRDKFICAFKTIISKETNRIQIQRIDGSKIHSMNQALREFFADQVDRDDLLALVEELKNQDLKVVER